MSHSPESFQDVEALQMIAYEKAINRYAKRCKREPMNISDLLLEYQTLIETILYNGKLSIEVEKVEQISYHQRRRLDTRLEVMGELSPREMSETFRLLLLMSADIALDQLSSDESRMNILGLIAEHASCQDDRRHRTCRLGTDAGGTIDLTCSESERCPAKGTALMLVHPLRRDDFDEMEYFIDPEAAKWRVEVGVKIAQGFNLIDLELLNDELDDYMKEWDERFASS